MVKVFPDSQELASSSEKVAPTAKITSASRQAALAAGVPQNPAIPTHSGCESGTVPLAIRA